MTSPRTPRQWNAGSEEPPRDVTLLRREDGYFARRVRGGRGWWFVADAHEEIPAGEDGWPWWHNQVWPLSEVLPETPEPPDDDEALENAVAEAFAARRADAKVYTLTEQKPRCGSCDHLVTDHGDGCYFTVTVGTIDGDLVCQCTVPASQSVPAVPVSSTGGKETGEAAEDATEELRARLVAIVEWAERSKITGRVFVTSEQYARRRVNLFPSELELVQREVGPWIEVTS